MCRHIYKVRVDHQVRVRLPAALLELLRIEISSNKINYVSASGYLTHGRTTSAYDLELFMLHNHGIEFLSIVSSIGVRISGADINSSFERRS
jgi:hypothetical protein